MKKLLSSTVAFVAAVLLFCGIYFAFLPASAQTAQMPPEKVVADFSGELSGWTAQNAVQENGTLILSANGSFKTQDKFLYFMADFTVSGAFELVFGDENEMSYTISVNADNTFLLGGLKTDESTDSGSFAHDLKLGTGNTDIRLKVIGSSVVLYGRAESDAFTWYELGSYKFVEGKSAVYGCVGISASSQLTIKKAAVYSLDSNIDIEADDYDPADEVTGKHKKPVRGLSGGAVAAIAAGCSVVVIGAAAVATVMIVKKRRKKAAAQENTEEQENTAEISENEEDKK